MQAAGAPEGGDGAVDPDGERRATVGEVAKFGAKPTAEVQDAPREASQPSSSAARSSGGGVEECQSRWMSVWYCWSRMLGGWFMNGICGNRSLARPHENATAHQHMICWRAAVDCWSARVERRFQHTNRYATAVTRGFLLPLVRERRSKAP